MIQRSWGVNHEDRCDATQPAHSPTEKSEQRCGAEGGCLPRWVRGCETRKTGLCDMKPSWDKPYRKRIRGGMHIFYSAGQGDNETTFKITKCWFPTEIRALPLLMQCKVIYLFFGDLYLLVSPTLRQEMRSTIPPVE